MAVQTAIKTSAIQTPSDANTTLVQRQMKESIEVGQRLRGDPQDSFVRVRELTQGGLWTLANGVLVPSGISKLGSGGGGGTVNVTNSITGDGSSGTPLKLSGDAATPGNLQLYGTNGSGVKGWYSQPSGGSVTVSDGVHSVSGATSITFSGAVVSGTAPNAAVSISGAAAQVPGTIADLLYWLRADQVLGTNGQSIPNLGNSTPWVLGPLATLSAGTVTVASAQLNSLNTLQWPGSSAGRYAFPYPTFLPQVTIFVVARPTSSSNQTLLGAPTGGLEMDINTGASGVNITKAFTAVIASCTASLTSGTWYQINVTYNSTTGAWAFKVARTAAGSGTNAVSITTPTSGLGYNVAANGNDLSAAIAELIIYNRVLSSGEITSVETYLNSKWGV